MKKKIISLEKNNTNPLEVLIESEKNGKYIGLDQHFNQIEVESEVDLVGDWIFIENYEAKVLGNVAKFR